MEVSESLILSELKLCALVSTTITNS